MNKTDFLEILFESEIYGVSRFNRQSKEYSDVLNSILETRKALNEILDDEQQELFLKFADLQEQYHTINEFEGFAEGFRLGARCMLDVF